VSAIPIVGIWPAMRITLKPCYISVDPALRQNFFAITPITKFVSLRPTYLGRKRSRYLGRIEL